MSMSMLAKEAAIARRIGARLREAREAAGLSLREVAQAIGLRDHAVIIKYEQGRTIPSSARLVSLATAIGVSPAALLAVQETAIPLITVIDQADDIQLAQIAFMVGSLVAPEPERP